MKNTFSNIDFQDSQGIRELNIVLAISQNIINTLDYSTVLQVISNGMSELLEIETAAIYMLDGDNGLILEATTPPLPPNFPDEFRKASIEEHPHIIEAISKKKAIIIPNTDNVKLSTAEKNVVEMRQLRSLVFLPFIQKNTVLGVLILGTCNNSREYSKHDIELGQMVANQLSVAIQNTKLHVDLKNYKDNLEKLVEERTYDLEAANEELQMINEELHEKNTLIISQKEEIETTLEHVKSIQANLIQSEKMASLGILTAGVAHEINNPLNYIMGASYGLEDFFNTTGLAYKDEVGIFLNGLKTGVNKAADIVNGLNQFSRDNNKYNETCNIHSIIDNCLSMVNGQIDSDITINKFYENEDITVEGNVGKLHQAFLNLLTNSVQAIHKKGQITISTSLLNKTIQITINDTGSGIKKDNLNKISDPFFTTKDPGKGTGLGLSIVYTIIQEHKGSIAFESEVNKGTQVIVSLPIKK